MRAYKIVTVALFLSLFSVLPRTKCQIRPRPLPPPAPPRPLCASQFALVNYACSMLPFNPAPPIPPPPSPPSPDSPDTLPPPPDDDEVSLQRRGGHRHRHRHGHGRYVETPEEENCCRWLKEIDNECVCDLLVRLPVFLARPVHEYRVIVDPTCNVTYTCSGRLRP